MKVVSLWKNAFALLVPLFVLIDAASADFDDFVDPTYDCPALTTCPVICAENATACPTPSCAAGLTLCADGSCADSCSSRANRNPCPQTCLPFACPKIIEDYETCQRDFEAFYANEEVCREQEEDAKNSFSAGPLSILGLWLMAVTMSVLGWCRMMRRYHTDAVTQPLEDGQTQTGYRETILGQILYYSVVITLLGIQALLLAFCITSYRQNEEEALRGFEITWCIGFVWTLALKWPCSVASLFLVPCELSLATQVAVFTETRSTSSRPVQGKREAGYIMHMRRILSRFTSGFHSCMSGLFSVPYRTAHGILQYVPVQNERDANLPSTYYFVYQFRRYNLDDERGCYVPGKMNPEYRTVADVLKGVDGLTADEVTQRLHIVGPNVIDMPKPTLLGCIRIEFSKPFYTYQTFILWTWVPLYYFYLAVIHGSVILMGGLSVSYFRFRNERNLYVLTQMHGEVNVRRDGIITTIPQSNLVPGDIVQVQPGVVYTDMVVTESEGLLVDESALTGESNPVAKNVVDPAATANPSTTAIGKKHSILAGTTVLEQENTLAMVVATGSFTSKGELLRDVFHYERHQFQFDVEVGFVVGILVLQSIFMFALVVFLIQEQPVYAWFYGMYVVGTLLPPLLPTVFTVSVGISDQRLSKKRIACSNSEDILVAGKVQTACFDKTGTLTKQGLDFVSAQCIPTWNDPHSPSSPLSDTVALGMACCHSLTTSGDAMIGNAVDRVMFAASGAQQNQSWIVLNGNRMKVLKQFDFCHNRMTQSVIVKRVDGSMLAIVKGSGENVQRVCLPASLPQDYERVLRESAKAGIYQISMAAKVLSPATDLEDIQRDKVELNMEFAGVINFQNVLREETPYVITQLQAGAVECLIVTGDAVLTGITIARESGIIPTGAAVLWCAMPHKDDRVEWVDFDHEGRMTDLPWSALRSGTTVLAVTGDVWDSLDISFVSELSPFVRVFGRCTPAHKVAIISHYCDQGKITLMCGDGGNDCGALKAAHVGVALSDAEASMVSPFTSLDKSIVSVTEILKEGRCALASALASYKYVIMYGQVEAIANVMNAYFMINLSEYCWMFMDGFWVISMSFTLPLGKAASALAETRPTASLLGPITASSVVGILLINTTFAIIALWILFHQDWFQCRRWENSDVSNLVVIGDNYESETLFLVMGYQYISTAMAFNFGYEFRQTWWRNKCFVGFCSLFTAIHLWVTLVPGDLSCFWRVNCENDHVLYSAAIGRVLPIQNPFHTTVMPVSYRWILVILMISNTFANIFWEYFVVNGTRRRLGKKRRERRERDRLVQPKVADDRSEAI